MLDRVTSECMREFTWYGGISVQKIDGFKLNSSCSRCIDLQLLEHPPPLLPPHDVFIWTNIIITMKYLCCFCTTDRTKLGSYTLIDDFSQNLIFIEPSSFGNLLARGKQYYVRCTQPTNDSTKDRIWMYIGTRTALTMNDLRQISSMIAFDIRIASAGTHCSKYAFARTVQRIVER